MTFVFGSGAMALAPYALIAMTVVLIVAYSLRRAARERRDEASLAAAIRDDLHPPASLHPLIDPDICIGSLSCIKACPEGDILGIVDGTAKLIVGSNCIGHGRCALECPVDAIKLVFGSSQRGVDLPDVDENFETSRAGVHIVGELGGMGLIKNAFRQGLQAADHLRRVLPSGTRSASDETDVLIVGAGPAGLAAAVGCRTHGLRFRVVDQGRFGGSILDYPRQKIVMSEAVTLPGYGKFGKARMSKEDLLEGFEQIRKRAKIRVEEGVQVHSVGGDDGAFLVGTSAGVIRAKKVVLAIGRRGSPRRLAADGADLDKVTYQLRDPEQYAGKRVLVVGGGDSALEAAIQLAEQPGTTVTLSYRQAVFARCRDANRRKITQLLETGAVRSQLATEVVRVTDERVVLRGTAGEHTIDNDYVIACLGGELPIGFLKAAGVDLVRHRGAETAKPHHTPGRRPEGKRNYLALALSLIGVSLIGGLWFLGHEYYAIAATARARSPLHDIMRPAGIWGHGVGIVATLFMMLNFLYPLRKRLGFLKGTAPIRSWLTFHVFVGVMSPLLIAFHAAFQSRNLLATSTYVALVVVVVTGLFGRFLYGLMPSADGKANELSMLQAQLERHQQQLGELARGDELQQLVGSFLEQAQQRRSLIMFLIGAPFRALRRIFVLRAAKRLFADIEGFYVFREAFREYEQLATQTQFYRSLRRLLAGWRAFHVVLSVLLVFVIAVHVWLSIYLGYRWIFR